MSARICRTCLSCPAAIAILLACIVGLLDGELTVSRGAQPLTVTSNRQVYNLNADFNAAVGGFGDAVAFWLHCDPAVASETTLTVTTQTSFFTQIPDSPIPSRIICGYYYFISFRFTPLAVGLVSDLMTVTTGLGTATVEIIGNGYVEEWAPYWIVELPPGTSVGEMLYHPDGKRIFISDYNSDRVIVFSTEDRTVVKTIPVGIAPIGMTFSPDGKMLYVAHVQEQSIAEIDVASLTEKRRILLPSLGNAPYALSFISEGVMLIGQKYGGPYFELDLNLGTLTAHRSLSGGYETSSATSKDLSTTVVLHEPKESPTKFFRYDHATGTTVTATTLMDGTIDREVMINADGSMIVANDALSCTMRDLRVMDRDLSNVQFIMARPCKVLQMVFADNDSKIYTTADEFQTRLYAVDEIDVAQFAQTRSLKFWMPDNYGTWPYRKAMTVSDDGRWVFTVLALLENDPPSKLLGMRVGSTPGSTLLSINKNGTGTGSVTAAGINCGADCLEEYSVGTSVALTATPDQGSIFDGWSGDPDCNDGTVTMDKDKGCVASFRAVKHLTVHIIGGNGRIVSWPAGIDCPTQCSGNFTPYMTVELWGYPGDGFAFNAWSGGGGSCDGTSNLCQVWMTRDNSVNIKFLPSTFILLDSAKGGEVWHQGQRQKISWRSLGVVGDIKVDISRDGGTKWKTIVKKQPNYGWAMWKVSKPATTRARIRVCSLASPSVCGESDSDFTVK